MKTTPITASDLAASIIAVPPLCRAADLSLAADENRKLIRHLENGGVRTLLYGGNANLYNMAISEYPVLLDFLVEAAGEETLVIPSVGPFYGTMMDQAGIVKERDFPAAMILPTLFPASVAGVQKAVRHFVERSGVRAVVYIKDAAYLMPEAVKELADDGLLAWIKYAIVREHPEDDPFLKALVDLVDPKLVVSGIGEQPAITHVRTFGLAGFTSGCVCVAPKRSMAMLQALTKGEEALAEEIRREFAPLEDQRNAHGPIPVLHHAVALAGIAETGPHLPLLDSLPSNLLPAIERAARVLLALEPSSGQCA